MATVTYTPTAQDGHITAGGLWNDTDATLIPGDGTTADANSWLGLILDFGDTTESERSLRLDPPIRQLSNLILTESGATASDCTLYLYFVNEFTPADYSDTALPGARGEAIADNLVSTVTMNGASGTTSATFSFANDTPNGRLRSLMLNANWNGRLARSVQMFSNSSAGIAFISTEGVGNSPTLTLEESNFHTGHNKKFNVRGRARHCARSGLPANTVDLVEDGFTEGIHVLPEWWEPEDRMGLDIVIPDSEGEIDDKNTGSS